MRKYLTFLTVFLCLTNFLQGQKKNGNVELFNEAESFFSEKDYKEAVYSYIKLLNNGRNTPNVNFKIGSCYLNIRGAEAKAIPYLEAAVKHVVPKYKYDDKAYEQTSAPLHAWFYLGNAYHFNNELGKALDCYTKFTTNPGYEDAYGESVVEAEIKACERAKVIADKPIKINTIHLDSTINSSVDNYNAVLSGDGKMMAFMSETKFYQAIYISHLVDGKWTNPESINEQVLSDGDMFVSCLSFDGSELYLVKKELSKFDEEASNSDIYVATCKDGRWTEAKPLNKNINSSRLEEHASVSADGKTLYFASNRRGGEGGLDIYKSERAANGDWGPAKNMGKGINTKLDENTPFITQDGNTLFFSSKGLYGMGGYDIFYTKKQASGKWEDPVNIGFPINSTTDDLFFFPVDNGKAGYIAKNLPDSYGKLDIYRIEILKGK
jgi:hypothetical protein